MDACAKCNCSTSILWMQWAQVQWSNFGLAGSQSRFCCARRKNSGPLGVWPGAPTDWWFGWSSSSITSSSSEDSTDSILTSNNSSLISFSSFTFGIAFAGGPTGGAALEDAAPKDVDGGIDGMAFTGVLMFTSLNGLLGIAFGWTSSDKAWKGGRAPLAHSSQGSKQVWGTMFVLGCCRLFLLLLGVPFSDWASHTALLTNTRRSSARCTNATRHRSLDLQLQFAHVCASRLPPA